MVSNTLLEQSAALLDEARKLNDQSIEGWSRPRADDLEKLDKIQSDIESLRYAARFDTFIRTGEKAGLIERRALSADVLEEGGAIVAPQQFNDDLLKKLDDAVVVRAGATKYTLGSAGSLGIPTIAADPEDPEWTSEVHPVDFDSALTFGKRVLSPNMLTKCVKVSVKLMQRAEVKVVAIVADRLAAKFAEAEETAFMTGNGEGKPLGLFYASALGISTARDIVGTNTSTAITADSILDTKFALRKQYRKDAKWILSRDAIRQISLLKAHGNIPLWQPSVALGTPDRLDGIPVVESEYVPSTFTTGQYVGILGNLSHYCIVDQLPYSIQRLNELYAATNQVGFIGRMSLDGMPTDEMAFARIKLG